MFDFIKNILNPGSTPPQKKEEVYVEVSLEDENKEIENKGGIQIPKNLHITKAKEIEDAIQSKKEYDAETALIEEYSDPKLETLDEKLAGTDSVYELSEADFKKQQEEEKMAQEAAYQKAINPEKETVDLSATQTAEEIIAARDVENKTGEEKLHELYKQKQELAKEFPEFAKTDKTITQSDIVSDISDLNKIKKQDTENIGIQSDLKYLYRGIAYFLGAAFFTMLAFFVFRYAENYIYSTQTTTETRFVFDNPIVRADDSRAISLEIGAVRQTIKNTVMQILFNEEVKLGRLTIVAPSYLKEKMIDGVRSYSPEQLRGDDFFFVFAESATLALRSIV